MKKLSAFLVLFVLVCMGAVAANLIPKFETSYDDNGKFFLLKLRGMYVFSDGDVLRLDTKPQNSIVFNEAYLFQFVGNTNSFQIYNKGTKTQYGVANGTTDNLIFKSGVSQNLKEQATQNAFCIESNPTTVVNDFGGNRFLATWVNGSASDAGSIFVIEEVSNLPQLVTSAKNEAVSLLTALNNLDGVSEKLAIINNINPSTYTEWSGGANNVNTALNTIRDSKIAALNGKQVNIRIAREAETVRYVYVRLNDQLGHEAATLAPRHVFTLTMKSGKLKLRSALTGYYAGVNVAYDTAQPTNLYGVCFDILTATGGNGWVNIKPDSNTTNADLKFWHALIYTDGGVGLWNASPQASKARIEPSTVSAEDILAAAKERITYRPTTVEYGYPYSHSDEVQQVITSGGIEDVYNVYPRAKNLKIKVPLAGDFIRIKVPANTNYPYVCLENTSSNALTLKNTADISTVFYMYANNKMVNIATGKAVGKNTNSGNWEVGAYGAEMAGNVNFKGDAPVGKLSILGWDNQRWLNANKTAATTGVSNNRIVDNNSWTSDFIIEPVTTLTLPLSAQGLATFVVPAGKYVNVSEGTKAYIIKSVNSTSAHLTEVTGGIGKENEPVAIFLRGSQNGTATLTFVEQAGSNDFTGNLLKGVAQPSGDTKKTVTNDFTFNGVEFIPVATDLKYRPFRAILDGTLAAGVQSLALDFDNITSIEALEALGSDAPLYDLSGRRVLNPTKGSIYIKNGHKFVQQ